MTAIEVCTHCRRPKRRSAMVYRLIAGTRYPYHRKCLTMKLATPVAEGPGVERDPEKWGGHKYQGPSK